MAINLKLENDPFKDLKDPSKMQDALENGITKASDKFQEEVKKGFLAQQTPGGSAWQALSDDYGKRKRALFGNLPMLVGGQPNKVGHKGEKRGVTRGGGAMKALLKKAVFKPAVAFSKPDNSNGVSYQAELTVNDPQGIAAVQNNGGGNNIPARPFFTVEGDALQAVTESMLDGFEKKLGL